jgi:adenosylmethionine-8-amino-7-oxononanoate aminotransferase
VLLIFDEVLTAFGRTGACLPANTRASCPTFSALAKGLTGGFCRLQPR